MNANELAEGILAIEERIFLTKKEHQLFQNSATMLLQQQAEIEALKDKLMLTKQSLEIANQSLVGATAWHNPDLDPINFARAILRKAQEK